jgi:O-antigen/teichoic acid export membrane protein
VLAVIASVWADDFYRLWVGRKALNAQDVSSVVTLFRILVLAVVVEFASGTAGQILMGMGRVRVLAMLAISQGLTNLLVSVILVHVWGLTGVAIGTLAAALAHRLFLTNWILGKELNVGSVAYLCKVMPRPLFVGATLAASCLLMRQFGPAASWPMLAGYGMAALASAVVLSVLVGVEPEIRRRLLQKIWIRPQVYQSAVRLPVSASVSFEPVETHSSPVPITE